MNTLDQSHKSFTIMSDQTSALAQNDPGQQERLIKPSQGWIAIDWKELLQSRELFDTLVLRDIKIRYKQTILGVAWAVIQPLLSMAVFVILFRNIPGIRPDQVPYELFVFAGQVPWTFFTNAVTTSGTSLLSQQQLLTKIYFPRLFVPGANVGAYLVDLGIGLLLFALLLPWFHYTPSIHLLFLPFLIVLTFAAALGLGLLLASMTILFRDLRFIIPFAMQVLMFASPIFYSPAILSRRMQLLVSLNPMTGIISAYRWCILGMELDTICFVISTITTVGLLVYGLFFFRRTEKYFADLL